jgi:two-component system, chemotaxis family, response regulator Rcp1
MNSTASHKQVEILLVEDNPGDVRLTTEALKEGKITNHLNVVNDGIEAMAFLRKEGKYSNVNRPDLILLDLNMPKKDGREVLTEIKNDHSLKSIPVIILTTSESEQDILMTYESHANCFISKPVDLDQFLKVTQLIEEFWLSIVKLPPNI